MNGRVFEIKRFAVHDGPGIRTTVFLKGCPLKCLWCHNPEGIDPKPQLAFFAHKCLHCGLCSQVCPSGRTHCIACGACAEACPGGALQLFGKEMRAQALLPLLLEDRTFYENSGGGVTLSGGECLMQPGFCEELLHLLKENGIHTAVDTCGFVSRESLARVMPYTDVFLYDIKAMDVDLHRRCTGQSNRLILENLRYLDSQGCRAEVRIPFVPGLNDGEIPAISKFLSELNCLSGVRILPYHNYAGSKYRALGMENTLPEQLPSHESLENARHILLAAGLPLLD